MIDMDALKIAKDIHQKVHKSFIYESDEQNYQMSEHWTSHADDVYKMWHQAFADEIENPDTEKRFKDDCDGFALTCAELLIVADVPREKVKIIICHTETGEGHLVCALDHENNTYILDNRYRFVYYWEEATRIGYRWDYFMSFDEPGVWKKVDNGTITT